MEKRRVYYYCQLERWTLEEAELLRRGIDPKEFERDKKQYATSFIAAHNENINILRHAIEYSDLSAEQFYDCDDVLRYHIKPQNFINWAKQNGCNVPVAMEELIKNRPDYVDFEAKCLVLEGLCKNKDEHIKELQDKIATSEQEPKLHPHTKKAFYNALAGVLFTYHQTLSRIAKDSNADKADSKLNSIIKAGNIFQTEKVSYSSITDDVYNTTGIIIDNEFLQNSLDAGIPNLKEGIKAKTRSKKSCYSQLHR